MYCIVCGAMVSSPWRLLAIIYAVCVVLIVATGRNSENNGLTSVCHDVRCLSSRPFVLFVDAFSISDCLQCV